jgi:glycerol-3-phosphate dehydrogenase
MPDFELIVVGGGINGSAIARDAALRGLNTLLIERDDFASGASGRNGRMIHGGLRYLEQGEVGLVREALRERSILLAMAPHIVRRRDVMIPVRRGVGRPAWMVRAGLTALDLLAFGSAPRHQFLSRAETLRRVPALNSQGLRGAALMFDAFAENAERLTIENLLDAAANGATIRNHSRVRRILSNGRAVAGVEYEDARGDVFTATAPLVVNATGAWGDEFLRGATGTNRQLLGASKGTFIVVAAFPGAPSGSVFFEAAADRRPIIVTPWRGLYLIGTTDVRVSGPIDEVRAEPAEIQYLLTEILGCFPDAGLTRQSILYSYTGVRPLPFATGASRKVPRHHIIHDHAPELDGLLTIIGGKLSTFRSLAEDALKVVANKVGRPLPACTTATRPLPGAQGTPDRARHAAEQASVSPLTARRLTELYGMRADRVLAYAIETPELAAVIDASTGAIAAEIVLAVREEWAQSFADILLRRMLIGRNGDLGVGALNRLEAVAARHLGWTTDRIKQNRSAYLRDASLSQPSAIVAMGNGDRIDPMSKVEAN